MSIEITCDSCAEVRTTVDIETLEAAFSLRGQAHSRPPRYNFCADRSGCREKGERWKGRTLLQLLQPYDVSFGEYIGDAPGGLYGHPLTPELISDWFRWVMGTGREHELFEFVGQALRALLQDGGPQADLEGISQADLPAATAIAIAAELGLCDVPAPREGS